MDNENHKPLIGITTGRNPDPAGEPWIMVVEAYVRAVLRAGGAPVLLPVGLGDGELADIQPLLAGVLLTGGGDIDPARFDGDPHPRVDGVDPQRDDLDITMARWAAESGTPFLGICRGCQVVNVALGGDLYTDIPDQHPGALRHVHLNGEPRSRTAHEVRIEPGSRLAEITGRTLLATNSSHHQAARAVPSTLAVTAVATDGIIEALELPHHPFGVAVQWHPEWLPDAGPHQAIFRAFIEAAGEK